MLQVCSHAAYHYQGAVLTQSIHTLTHVQSAIVSNCNTHIGASNGSTNNKPTYTHPTLADGCARLHFYCSEDELLQTCSHLMSNQPTHLCSIIKPPERDGPGSFANCNFSLICPTGKSKESSSHYNGWNNESRWEKGEEGTTAGGWKEVWLRIVKSFCSYLLNTYPRNA